MSFAQDPAAAAYAHYQKQRGEHSNYAADAEGAKHTGHNPTVNGSSHSFAPHVPEHEGNNAPLNLSLSSASHQYRQPVITSSNHGNGQDGSPPDYRPRRREVTQGNSFNLVLLIIAV